MTKHDDNHDYSHSHSTINSHDKETTLRDNKPPGYWDDEPETEIVEIAKAMNTPKTPAEAAHDAYWEDTKFLARPTIEVWPKVAQASIDAYLAHVSAGLPTIQEMQVADDLNQWGSNQVGRLDTIRDLFTDRFAKLQAERDELQQALSGKTVSCGSCNAIAAERDSLQAWKASMMAVEAEWDEQKLARLLDVSPGQSCRKVIAQRVPEILAERDSLRQQLSDTMQIGDALNNDVQRAGEKIEELRRQNDALLKAEQTRHHGASGMCCMLRNEAIEKLGALKLELAEMKRENTVCEGAIELLKGDVEELNARLIERTNESLRKLEEKTKRERYVPIEEHEEMKRVAVEALEEVDANIYAPDTNCSCHISPPCNDCVENGATREVLTVVKSALTTLKGTK